MLIKLKIPWLDHKRGAVIDVDETEASRIKRCGGDWDPVEIKPIETKAALTSETGTQGGYLVPEAQAALKSNLFDEIVWPRARKLRCTGVSLSVPMLNTKTTPTGGSALFGGLQATYTANQALTEYEPTFIAQKMTPHELGGAALVSNSLYEDADSITALQTAEASLTRYTAERDFLTGNGVGKPLGVTNSAALIAVTRATASTIKTDDVAALESKLIPWAKRSTTAYVASPSALAKLLLNVTGTMLSYDSNGQPLLVGRPLLTSEFLPALGTANDLILCDFGWYYIAYKTPDPVVEASGDPKFDTNQRAVRWIWRIDGQPGLNASITGNDGSSAFSPFVGLN